MSTFKSAMLGCGPRAERHAQAYAHVSSLELMAAADLDADRAAAFAEAFGLSAHYTDYEAMLREQQPDLLHIVTQPQFRLEPLRACVAAGVPAAIIEKPMAEDLATATAIEELVQASGLKVMVNTQRRYFASWRAACEVAQSRLGKLRSIRVHTSGTLSCMGSHLLDLVQDLLDDAQPESIWATAAGAQDFHTNHPGPTHTLASLIYPGRLSVMVELSNDGVAVPGVPYWFSSGIEIWGASGHVWWTDGAGWGYQVAGEAELRRFPSDFATDDAAGQGAFTEAIGSWLGDPGTPHRNRLETALRVYRIVCTIVESAVAQRRIPYDDTLRQDAWDALRQQLIEREGDHPERVAWGKSPDVNAEPW